MTVEMEQAEAAGPQTDETEPPGPQTDETEPDPHRAMEQRSASILASQFAPDGCLSCGAETNGSPSTVSGFVYALGRVAARFPSLAVEKEFAQATGRATTAGMTDPETMRAVLAERQNRYLARQLCWVFTIEGLETYLLQPRDPADLDLLLEALRPVPRGTDIDVVIGLRGPIAPSEACNGLMVPIVVFDQLYSFDVDSLLKAIPRPEKVTAKQFEPAAEDLLNRIMQLADNAGAEDEHRALNYLAVRYDAIYHRVAESNAANFSLTGVEVRPSRLSGTRRILDAIFSFTHRQSGITEQWFVRVDVTEEFPFLVTKLSHYYER